MYDVYPIRYGNVVRIQPDCADMHSACLEKLTMISFGLIGLVSCATTPSPASC